MNLQLLSEKVGKILLKKGLTLAVAESCTGGMVSGAVTAVPGSSRYFTGGVIAYHDRIKRNILKVPLATLMRHGAVSGPTVAAMVRGVQRLFKTDCAIAVSGVAGPDGGTRKKPIGLVYIAVAVKNDSVHARKYRFKGSREEVRNRALESSLKLLITSIKL
jgi:PncC family amidohydrolase